MAEAVPLEELGINVTKESESGIQQEGVAYGETTVGRKGSDKWNRFCRICHEGTEDGRLIEPCRCTGSLQFCHEACLLRWVQMSLHNICEICHIRYRIRSAGLRDIRTWTIPALDFVDRYHLCLAGISGCMILFIILFFIYIGASTGPEATQYRLSELAPAFFAVYSGMGAICVVIFLGEWKGMILPYIRRFQIANRRLVILEHIDTKDTGIQAPDVDPLSLTACPIPLKTSVVVGNEEEESPFEVPTKQVAVHSPKPLFIPEPVLVDRNCSEDIIGHGIHSSNSTTILITASPSN